MEKAFEWVMFTFYGLGCLALLVAYVRHFKYGSDDLDVNSLDLLQRKFYNYVVGKLAAREFRYYKRYVSGTGTMYSILIETAQGKTICINKTGSSSVTIAMCVPCELNGEATERNVSLAEVESEPLIAMLEKFLSEYDQNGELEANNKSAALDAVKRM